MSEQDQERQAPQSEDPDVEGHRRKAAYGEEGPGDDEIGRRETDEEPDVEAHRRKA